MRVLPLKFMIRPKSLPNGLIWPELWPVKVLQIGARKCRWYSKNFKHVQYSKILHGSVCLSAYADVKFQISKEFDSI